jgi:hypothetical protein
LVVSRMRLRKPLKYIRLVINFFWVHFREMNFYVIAIVPEVSTVFFSEWYARSARIEWKILMINVFCTFFTQFIRSYNSYLKLFILEIEFPQCPVIKHVQHNTKHNIKWKESNHLKNNSIFYSFIFDC